LNDWDDEIPYWYEVGNGLKPVLNDGSMDKDGDGMSNWYEWKYELNPTDPTDSLRDDDMDTLINGLEAQLGRDPKNSKTLFRISLTVSLEWDATNGEIEKIVNSFKATSLYLLTATDAYAYISHIEIYDAQMNWDTANIRIYNRTATINNIFLDLYWPHASIGGYWDGISWVGAPLYGEVVLPKCVHIGEIEIGEAFYSAIIAHELGHYVFCLYDEYATSSYEDLAASTLMKNAYWVMSYRGLYEEHPAQTWQWAATKMSCWEWFVYIMTFHGLVFDIDTREPRYVPFFETLRVDVNRAFCNGITDNPHRPISEIFAGPQLQPPLEPPITIMVVSYG
ncbi:MAG: hypothetical protein QXJ27_05905, partial [Thermoplasmata archaeon]